MGTSAFRLGASQANVVQLQEIIQHASHGFAAGDVVRPTGVGGVFALAQASSAAAAEGVGVISEVSTHSFTVVYSGEIVSNGLTSYSSGTVLFLSETTAGKLTTEPPTLPGEVIKTVIVMTGDSGEGLVVNYVGSIIGGESSVSVTNLQPVGAIAPYGGSSGSVPTGWFMCDGATYTSTSYLDLYDVIGTSFGGSGTTGTNDYFSVPDMQGRFVMGGGTGSGLTVRTRGETGGLEIVTNPLPPGTDGEFDVLGTAFGETGAINNLPPYLVTNYIIRHEKNSRASISGLLATDLGDMGISGPTAGDLIQYEGNGQTGKWENVPVSKAIEGVELPSDFTIAPPVLSAGVTSGYPYRVIDSTDSSTGPPPDIDDDTNFRYSGLRIITSGHTGSDKIWLQGNLIMSLDPHVNEEGRLFDFGIYTGSTEGLTAGAIQDGSSQYTVTGVGPIASSPHSAGITLVFPISFIHMMGTTGDVYYDIAVRLGTAGTTASVSPTSTYYAMNLYG